MVITGTYDLTVNPFWKNVQQQEVYLECDTFSGPVTINLFPIANLNRFWNVKINIVDLSQNCSVNNITINTGSVGTPPVQDTVDQLGNTQIILNKNGESVIFSVVSENQWLAGESITIPFAVQSVTGLNTDNTDPLNPIVKVSLANNTITGQGTPASPLVSNVVINTSQIISGTSGRVLFNKSNSVSESSDFEFDDVNVVLSLGGTTSGTKGRLNIKALNASASSFSIAIRKSDDSGYLFQTLNDGKIRINDTFNITNSDGTAGQSLVTDGAGNVSFQSKQDPISLTTTGNSGASSFASNVLNVPEYTLSGLGGVPTSRTLTINGTAQDLSADRTWTVSDANLSVSDIITNNVSTTQHGFAPKLPNDVTKYLDGTGNWSVPSSYGVWGIADTFGKYTFYNTLTLAMAAATAGQTIEMFADVTETGVVTITLKNGVNINGNGHTYNYTNAFGNCFQIGNASTIHIFDLKIIRSNTTPTGAYIFYFSSGAAIYTTCQLYCKNVYAYYSYTTSVGGTPTVYNDGYTAFTIDGLFSQVNGSGYVFSAVGGSGAGNFNNCTAISTGIGNGLNVDVGSSANNCYVSVNSGTGVANSGTISNSKVIADTGVAVSATAPNQSFRQGRTTNCYLYSRTYRVAQDTLCFNCLLISESGFCSVGSALYDSYCFTNTSGVATGVFNQPEFYNCYLISASAVTIPSVIAAIVVNSQVICAWNNIAGHAFNVSNNYGSVTRVFNSHVKVANSAANCLKGAVSVNMYYTNNTFEGATTPINANVTQLITNTQDNQGNILI